jgi:DNA gyrase/topoisomerase IV subunit B
MDNKIKVLSDINHVICRPGMYIGSVKPNEMSDYLYENGKYEYKEFSYIPGFITIFKEIISNSIDEYIRTDGKFANKIRVKLEDDYIYVEDNGRGISSEIVNELNLPGSVVAFTNLKAGSNFSDDGNTIGQNGVGASITNIFSKYFKVETQYYNEKTILECKNNLTDINYKTSNLKKENNFTKITYYPDFEKFGLSKLDKIHKNYIIKTITDYSICYPDIMFYINGKRVQSNFVSYCKLYNENCETFTFENLDIGVFSNDYHQISFVNGVNTSRGGSHVDFVINKFTYTLKDIIIKKYKEIKPLDIKNKLSFIINIRNFPAPRFDSQTKEYLINVNKDFIHLFSDVDFEKIGKKISKNSEMLYPIIETFKIKEELKKRQLLKGKEKKIAKKKIAKLIAANKNEKNTILFLAEGNSALSRFIEVRNKNEGGYPLRGKVISPQDTPIEKLLKNQEILDIISALNLKLSSNDISQMAYDKIGIMADADPDGYAIGCTLINFFYTFWPDIIKQEKLVWAISPVIIAKNIKTKKVLEFYTLNEYQNYEEFNNLEIISHNKGLGSLNKNQYRKMLDTLVIVSEDDISRKTLDMAFGKKIELRKKWLMED